MWQTTHLQFDLHTIADWNEMSFSWLDWQQGCQISRKPWSGRWRQCAADRIIEFKKSEETLLFCCKKHSSAALLGGLFPPCSQYLTSVLMEGNQCNYGKNLSILHTKIIDPKTSDRQTLNSQGCRFKTFDGEALFWKKEVHHLSFKDLGFALQSFIFFYFWGQCPRKWILAHTKTQSTNQGSQSHFSYSLNYQLTLGLCLLMYVFLLLPLDLKIQHWPASNWNNQH